MDGARLREEKRLKFSNLKKLVGGRSKINQSRVHVLLILYVERQSRRRDVVKYCSQTEVLHLIGECAATRSRRRTTIRQDSTSLQRNMN